MRLALPALRMIDPERAHRLGIQALAMGLPGGEAEADDERLAVRVMGLRFSNPLGLAAGFDKNGVAVNGLAALGFGFVEAGTVTPRPQAGNPRPRLFRLTEDRAVINRMGFNNAGLRDYARHLGRYRCGAVPVGANVGINKDGAEPERDYPALIASVAPLADYVVINVSSPNTPGLRDLQGETRLRAILAAVRSGVPTHPPLLVKVAPDLALEAIGGLVETCVEAGVSGLIVSNTTISRPPGLLSRHAHQTGGLSGRPLLTLSTEVLRRFAQLGRGRLVLIGAGGVSSGIDALMKIRAGASLVQLYSAFAYNGPELIGRIKREMLAELSKQGFQSVSEAIGVDI